MTDKFKPTHTGLMYGFIPVMLDMTIEDYPMVDGRYIGCELLLTIVEPIYAAIMGLATFLTPVFEPGFAIIITGEVKDD